MLRAQLQLDVVDSLQCLQEAGGMTALLRMAVSRFVEEACRCRKEDDGRLHASRDLKE